MTQQNLHQPAGTPPALRNRQPLALAAIAVALAWLIVGLPPLYDSPPSPESPAEDGRDLAQRTGERQSEVPARVAASPSVGLTAGSGPSRTAGVQDDPQERQDDVKKRLEDLKRQRERLIAEQERVQNAIEALPVSTPRDRRQRNWNPRRRHPYEMPLLEDPNDPTRPRPAVSRDGPFEFYFTRAAYSGYGLWGRYASWSVDYPKADVQFMLGIKRLIGHLDAYPLENPILLTDPALTSFPFLYAVEVGHMSLTEEEVIGLRQYLLAGGFMVIDDFWGSLEWDNLEKEFARILPGYRIVDLEPNHPVFHCFYDVEEIVQVPNVGKGREGGPTWEKDGFVAKVRGISDDSDRLMVVINWNSDLGDAWEWAEDPHYPLRFSTYAYQMGVNYIVYAMSH